MISKKIILLIKIIAIFCLFLIVSGSVLAQSATEIYFSPEKVETEGGKEIILELLINTNEQKITSFFIQILYPDEKLTFLDLETEGSITTDWVKKFKQTDGLITLIGGIKNGFTGQGKIAQLKFISATGEWTTNQAEISISPNSLALNPDQKNILEKANSAIISLVGQSTPQLAEATPAPVPQKSQKLNVVWILLPVLILMIAGLGYYFYQRKLPPLPPSPPESPKL